MQRRFNPGALLPIEVELLREKGSALRRLGEKLERLIAELGRLEKELAATAGATRARHLARYAALRRQAESERWKMIVQREAMGLSHHEDVDRSYPLPPATDRAPETPDE
jgi:hypothetical protein